MKRDLFGLNFAYDQSILTLENMAVLCTRDTGVAQSSSRLSKSSLIRFMFLVMNYKILVSGAEQMAGVSLCFSNSMWSDLI